MMRRAFAALVGLLMVLVLAACSDGVSLPGFGGSGGVERDPALAGGTLRIAAATELEDLAPVMERAADDLGFGIEMEFPGGTLENSERLAAGEFDGAYDGTWFATNRYVELIGASGKLTGADKIASSPVALGVRADTARELGWTDAAPTWSDIAAAAGDGDLTFAMTDPGTSNSGFSALVSVATALADTGNALTVADIDRVAPQLSELFGGQTVTSGSSGWLADTFRDDPSRADALVNYESVLHALATDGLDIEVIVPADGVVSADYPLSALAEPADPLARERVAALAEWLHANPDVMAESFRRPAESTDLDPALTTDLLIELPFPGSREVTDRLVDAYQNTLRAPGDTAFVLDTSESMTGERMTSLQETMVSLVDGTARSSTGPVGLRDRERVSLMPFSSAPAAPTTVRFSTTDPGPGGELRAAIEGLQPAGATALYSALIDAYGAIEVGDGAIPSIVLMSDGENTAGADLQQFLGFHRGLPEDRRSIPVFVILYGEANVAEMEEVAEVTGGKVFDALDGDLGAAFREIRGYQ